MLCYPIHYSLYHVISRCVCFLKFAIVLKLTKHEAISIMVWNYAKKQMTLELHVIQGLHWFHYNLVYWRSTLRVQIPMPQA